MIWDLEWGKYEDFLQQQKAKGRDAPAMETKPTLLRRYVREWNVYAELHRTRQLGYGVGPQPIQPSEIAAWLDLHCIFSPEMRLWYYDIVRGIDLRYVTYSRNKISSEVENKKQG